ncbi:hypothetical protein GGS23DRAFT_556399 [Durotheca rogersii]|uniref:uncharacterized protein n=1 Tax=Durotheca rogersii TaxID=419775 RepID=UPI0022210FEB|nr:uncharacterized protein GGS23DRAFT_556399 [Durotheca rogersii]KAI5866288.1 hypothetical protein GGS23DRAFT_556399 [Durotheca rogersii]
MFSDKSVEDVILVTQLPRGAWCEGLALRPNGSVLISRLDKAELYTFDAEDPEAEPQVVHSFDAADASGVVGLCRMPGERDEYLALSSVADLAQVRFSRPIVWRVALGPDGGAAGAARVTKVAEIAGAGFCIDVVAASERVALVPDSGAGCVWRLDLATGAVDLFARDDAMRVAPGDGNFFGINRARLTDEHLWFTNTSAGTLCRVPVAAVADDAAVALRPAGPVETLATGLRHCDGLALTRDRRTVYTCCYTDGHIWRVNLGAEPGAAAAGTPKIVMRDLASPTLIDLRYVGDRPKVVVVCCGRVEMAWFHRAESNPWIDLATLTEAITITVEETVEETVEGA